MTETTKGMVYIQKNPEPTDDGVKQRNGITTFWAKGKPWSVVFKCDGEETVVASGTGVAAVQIRTRVADISDEPKAEVESP